MRTEKHLQNHIQKQCKMLRIRCYKMQCEGRRGFPDLLLVSKGHTLFIELKSPAKTGRVSANQVKILEELHIENQDAFVIDDKESADAIIKAFNDLGPRCRSLSAI